MIILFLFSVLSAVHLFDRPVIGIITQPDESGMGHSSIPASYVKWIESGGAKVVPFLYDMNQTVAEYLFHSVNGFVFPGGGVSLKFGTPYMDLQRQVYNLAIKANDMGDYFPVHGTCLGFESLVILSSQNDHILEYPFDSYNISMPLDFAVSPESTRMFSFFPPNVVKSFQTESVTLNNHHTGISPTKFLANESLKEFYSLISTNKGRQGKEFVSTIEANKYPIYGTQWHPEKIIFEDRPIALDQSFNSVLANMYISLFFVNEARKSRHKFITQEIESKYLIYNYQPTFVFPSGSEFEQKYYFPKASETHLY